MKKPVIDCGTGEVSWVDLSPEEAAAIDTEAPIAEEHLVADPMAEALAEAQAQIRELLDALDKAKVIDAETVRAAAADSKADDTTVLTIAMALNASPEEVAKIREGDPERYAQLVEKYGPPTEK